MSLLTHLAQVPDFRRQNKNFRHQLLDILVISVIAVLSGADDFEEIAANLNISMSELLHEVEQIIYSGTKLNINYYIENIMDDEREDILHDYFMKASTDKIREALQELEEEDFGEEEIKGVQD